MSFSATKWAWKQLLPLAEKIVLLSLAERSDGNSECWPSMDTIAGDCGMCRRNVIRVVSKLEAKGLISTQKRMTAHGKSSHIYTLNLAFKLAETPCDSHAHPDVTHGHIRVVTLSHIEPTLISTLPY